ncbi:Diacylglycerol kinase 2 [Armadillidium nasatum]|uniref:Diacylglycerol kinase 2 n=1 Tax=Armadillidium nasatum TaxID=96803 RepID=A0A5N5T0P9_9CRUS|nr:Diacylglycerol kinase 2 [Armadillidium nasatum]
MELLPEGSPSSITSSKHPPIVSILPLGTGNDLSRVLGWGESHSGSICAEEYLQKVNKAGTVSLDRWNVHFTAPRIFALYI